MRKASITRRRNARLGVPGRLRHEVARILADHFGRYIDPTHIRPAQGVYRSSPYHDVYRWEYSEYPLGSWGCWETMTEFVPNAKKYGIVIDNKEREIWVNYPRICDGFTVD